MNTPTSATIYKKLTRMEQELQRLKIQTYRALPQRPRTAISAPYTERAIQQAVQETREAIWQKRYAKKITGLR